MLPIIILAAVVVPLLVFAFIATRRSRAGGERLAPEEEAAQLRTEEEYEDEFEKAEDYQANWREEQRGHDRDDSLY